MTSCTVCSILDIVLNIQQSTFLKFLEILYLLHVVTYFVGNKIQTNSFEMYIYASDVKKSFNTYHDQETSNCIFELGTMTYQIYNALKLFMQMTFFVNEIRIKLQGKKVLMFKTIYIKKVWQQIGQSFIQRCMYMYIKARTDHKSNNWLGAFVIINNTFNIND